MHLERIAILDFDGRVARNGKLLLRTFFSLRSHFLGVIFGIALSLLPLQLHAQTAMDCLHFNIEGRRISLNYPSNKCSHKGFVAASIEDMWLIGEWTKVAEKQIQGPPIPECAAIYLRLVVSNTDGGSELVIGPCTVGFRRRDSWSIAAMGLGTLIEKSEGKKSEWVQKLEQIWRQQGVLAPDKSYSKLPAEFQTENFLERKLKKRERIALTPVLVQFEADYRIHGTPDVQWRGKDPEPWLVPVMKTTIEKNKQLFARVRLD